MYINIIYKICTSFATYKKKYIYKIYTYYLRIKLRYNNII